MKAAKLPATALLLLSFFLLVKTAAGQSLRGSVRDAATGDGLPSATVLLFDGMAKGDTPLVAATTDLTGGFLLKSPRPGVFLLKTSLVGFETRIAPEVELSFGKEAVADVFLKESPGQLAAVEVRPDPADTRLPTAGLHPLTRDAVLRQPVTFFDPARLAQSLPGVSNDDQNNGLSIRGLSPALFQYRIEGLEVVNPNHLSNAGTLTDLPTASSGGVSMLSAQMLGNSAIYTGCTPVGYGNSVGGLMDIRLRPGNDRHFEGTVQAGLVGLDVAAEGPFSRYSRASYLVNYRYSTIGLLQKMGVELGDEVVNFQDLSVHLNFPVGRNKWLSVFSVWGNSSNVFEAKDSLYRFAEKDFQNIHFGQKTWVHGAVFQKKTGVRRFTISGALSSTTLERDMRRVLNSAHSEFDQNEIVSSLRAAFQTRLFGRLPFEWGGEMGVRYYEAEFDYWPLFKPFSELDFNRTSTQMREFAQITAPFGKICSFNLGLRILQTDPGEIDSNILAFHPSASFVIEMGPRDRFVFTAQRSSQQVQTPEFLQFLFERGYTANSLNARVEKFLGSSGKAILAAFYQKFADFPVTTMLYGTSPPLDGTQFPDRNMAFTLGKAYIGGIEAALSRPVFNGFFYEINGSFFDSKQEVRPTEFIRTKFNSRWTGNFLAGKEWQKTRQSGAVRTLGTNLRFHARGGFRETPIDVEKSQSGSATYFQTGTENSLRLPNYYRLDLRLFWKKNRARRTGTLALDVQNATNRLNVAWHYYDPFLMKIVAKTGLGLVPILSYRLEFR